MEYFENRKPDKQVKKLVHPLHPAARASYNTQRNQQRQKQEIDNKQMLQWIAVGN